MRPELHQKIEYLNLWMVNDLVVAMEAEPTLESEIQEGQLRDPTLAEIWQLITDNKTNDFSEDS
jgi:hypothetical protein